MADRSSAALFAELFTLLADDTPVDRQSLARRLWDMTREYDFNRYQMYCDEALVKLGLAEMLAGGIVYKQ